MQTKINPESVARLQAIMPARCTNAGVQGMVGAASPRAGNRMDLQLQGYLMNAMLQRCGGHSLPSGQQIPGLTVYPAPQPGYQPVASPSIPQLAMLPAPVLPAPMLPLPMLPAPVLPAPMLPAPLTGAAVAIPFGTPSPAAALEQSPEPRIEELETEYYSPGEKKRSPEGKGSLPKSKSPADAEKPLLGTEYYPGELERTLLADRAEFPGEKESSPEGKGSLPKSTALAKAEKPLAESLCSDLLRPRKPVAKTSVTSMVKQLSQQLQVSAKDRLMKRPSSAVQEAPDNDTKREIMKRPSSAVQEAPDNDTKRAKGCGKNTKTSQNDKNATANDKTRRQETQQKC